MDVDEDVIDERPCRVIWETRGNHINRKPETTMGSSHCDNTGCLGGRRRCACSTCRRSPN